MSSVLQRKNISVFGIVTFALGIGLWVAGRSEFEYFLIDIIIKHGIITVPYLLKCKENGYHVNKHILRFKISPN